MRFEQNTLTKEDIQKEYKKKQSKKIFRNMLYAFFIIIIIVNLTTFFIFGEFLWNLGKNETQINHQNPCWSPDGTQILFSSNNDSNSFNMWLMNNDSSNAHPLLFGGEIDNEADYIHLPNGGWCKMTNEICFSSDRQENDEIWYVSEDRESLFQVTDHSANDWEPSWSPNGEWIVFQSDRTGNWDIFKIRKDGTELEQLTNNPNDDWQPCWSPDGTSILFQSDRNGNWQLYTIGNSSLETNIKNFSQNNDFEDTDASWSSSGELIAFSSDRSGNDADIYSMASNGQQWTANKSNNKS